MKSIKVILASLLFSTTAMWAQEADTTLTVNGVCGMCQETIEKAASLPGVSWASWDKNTKILQLRYDPQQSNLQDISESINRSGYDTEYETAPDSAYYGLHSCCHYRDPSVVDDHKEEKKR